MTTTTTPIFSIPMDPQDRRRTQSQSRSRLRCCLGILLVCLLAINQCLIVSGQMGKASYTDSDVTVGQGTDESKETGSIMGKHDACSYHDQALELLNTIREASSVKGSQSPSNSKSLMSKFRLEGAGGGQGGWMDALYPRSTGPQQHQQQPQGLSPGSALHPDSHAQSQSQLRRQGPIANALQIFTHLPAQLVRIASSPFQLLLSLLKQFVEQIDEDLGRMIGGMSEQLGRVADSLEPRMMREVEYDHEDKDEGKYDDSNSKTVITDEDQLRRMTERVSVLLELATESGDTCDEAWITRGIQALLPVSSPTIGGLPIDVHLAERSFSHALATSSNSTVQFLSGFLYASGLSKADRSQAQALALLHYTFSAFQGLPESEIALAHRHWTGLAVKSDCFTSLDWYESVGEKSVAHFLSGPPGGRTLPLTANRLSDLHGGVYGPGASWASTGPNSQRAVIRANEQFSHSSSSSSSSELDDILEWYQYQADRENYRMTVYLGKIFYTGSVYSITGGIGSGAEGVGAVGVDFKEARGYFLKVARTVWPKDPPLNTKTEANAGTATGTSGDLPKGFSAKYGQAKLGPTTFELISQPAALAAAYLGRMYLRGEGVARDYLTARMWLKRASDFGDREAHNMLGIVYRDGLGVKENLDVATHYFQAAAGVDLAEAKVNLGKLQLQLGVHDVARNLFTQAVASGNNYEAYFYLAQIHAEEARMHKDVGACGAAVAFYKNVAERGNWLWDYLGEGDRAWKSGEKEKALVNWWIAGEMGFEIAQNNVAYLLDQTDFPNLTNDSKDVALTHWVRSAAQHNVDAVVKVGDYYYHGIGVAADEDRYAKAASWYQSAADTQASAIAFWNLGWMYENGLGVAQDYHLAKRFYDLCGETDSEAYLPVLLSLIKLHIRSWWTSLIGGKEARLALFADDNGRQAGERLIGGGGAGGGVAKAQPRVPDEDDLEMIEWSRRREHERDEFEGSVEDNYYDSAGGWTTEGDMHIDEELADLLMIVLLITLGAMALLRTYRQRQQRQREEEEARRRGG